MGILPTLPDKGTYDKSVLNSYINELALEANSPQAKDTYWLGKHLGKLSCALPIAEQVNNGTASSVFLNYMKSTLEDWFTAKENETSNLFYYDSNWVSYRLSCYGSDDQLNDHHSITVLHAAFQVALRIPGGHPQIIVYNGGNTY